MGELKYCSAFVLSASKVRTITMIPLVATLRPMNFLPQGDPVFGRKSAREDLGGSGGVLGQKRQCWTSDNVPLTAICLFSKKMCERVKNRGRAGGCDEMIDSSGG